MDDFFATSSGQPDGPIKAPPSAFLHFEYSALHNYRIALTRRVDLWHQIGFPAAFVVFGFFFNWGTAERDGLILLSGAGAASGILFFVKHYTSILDQRAIGLYPRIIALELILQFYFFRDYLRTLPQQSPNGAERAFVEQAEALAAQHPDNLYEAIQANFDPTQFTLRPRLLNRLQQASWVLISAFWLIALYRSYRLELLGF